jgi:hypothetical protein
MGSAMIARTVPDAWLDAQRRGRGRMIGNATSRPATTVQTLTPAKTGDDRCPRERHLAASQLHDAMRP